MDGTAVESGLEVAIRDGGEGDEAFIFATWLRAAKRGTYEAKRIRDSVYFRTRHVLIEKILARGGQVLVAHPPDDPTTIWGYLVHEPGPKHILHWIYVALPMRRLGIATKLIEAACEDPNDAVFTAWTSWSLSIPTPKGVDRADRKAAREARIRAIREAETTGEAGGDTEDLIRKWPGMTFSPDLRFDPTL